MGAKHACALVCYVSWEMFSISSQATRVLSQTLGVGMVYAVQTRHKKSKEPDSEMDAWSLKDYRHICVYFHLQNLKI